VKVDLLIGNERYVAVVCASICGIDYLISFEGDWESRSCYDSRIQSSMIDECCRDCPPYSWKFPTESALKVVANIEV
jgi:hypothetical protein